MGQYVKMEKKDLTGHCTTVTYQKYSHGRLEVERRQDCK